MRRFLLGSVALAAAGAPTWATAGDGVRLELSGRYEFAFGAVPSERFSPSSGVTHGNLRDYLFEQDVEIDFKGETKLDNGLVVGALIELNGQSSQDDQIGNVFAFVRGGFGNLRFGDTDEAYTELCYQVPSASELFGADSPNFGFSNAGIAGYGATNGTCYGIDDEATKLVYFSPQFGGFHFATSFTPDDSEASGNLLDGAGTRFSNDAEQNSENLSAAATYEQEFGEISLVVGGGATVSLDKEKNPNDTAAARGYNAYVQAEFGDATIGVAMEQRDNLGEDGADQLVYGAGVTYDWDDWEIGLGWTRGDYEKAVGSNGVGPFNATHDIVAITGSYALSPGITLDGVAQYSHYEADDPAGPNYEGYAIGVGTFVSF
ncbi:MAG: porin [Dongiaceae bacterium]